MILYKDIVKDEENSAVLRRKSSLVPVPLTDEDRNTLLLMNEYLVNGYDPDLVRKYCMRPGVGLSAPQIGISKKMFCIMAYDEKGNLFHVGVVNPKIISHSLDYAYLETGEGCLSVETEYKGYVHRRRRIKASCFLFDFKTETLFQATLSLQGFTAIVFQHEYDHLNGILFFDRINKKNPYHVPPASSPIVFTKTSS